MQPKIRPSHPFSPTKVEKVTDKVRCPHDKFCPVSYCHSILGARIKSSTFVKARRCCLNVIFRVIIRSLYLNSTENSLTHNSLHTATKKTHSLQSKRQIILCLPRNYCLAIHETPLTFIVRCAKNSAKREMSVKMRGLIMNMFRPSPKTLYLRSFAFFFSTRLWTRHVSGIKSEIHE